MLNLAILKRVIYTLAVVVVLCIAGNQTAQAGPPGYWGESYADGWMYQHATDRAWHAPYAHTAFGRPVALVVPPTANLQTHYSWGVTGAHMSPTYHQFGRNYPGPGMGGRAAGIRPTPYYPGSTDQFGVYYVRAPW